jgi:hypothetical protein
VTSPVPALPFRRRRYRWRRLRMWGFWKTGTARADTGPGTVPCTATKTVPTAEGRKTVACSYRGRHDEHLGVSGGIPVRWS